MLTLPLTVILLCLAVLALPRILLGTVAYYLLLWEGTMETPGTPRRLLFIEDNLAFAGIAGHVMAQAGWRVEHVTTLAAARASLATTRPDLIILDPGLPDSISPLESLELARETRGIPLALLTGFADPVVRAQSRRLGFVGYLSKDLLIGNIAALPSWVEDCWKAAHQPAQRAAHG